MYRTVAGLECALFGLTPECAAKLGSDALRSTQILVAPFAIKAISASRVSPERLIEPKWHTVNQNDAIESMSHTLPPISTISWRRLSRCVPLPVRHLQGLHGLTNELKQH